MKKQFNILAVSIAIIGLAAGLFGMALFSEAAPADKNQNPYKEAPRPINAVNIQIAKKIPVSLALGEAKGAPEIPPGQYKKDDFSDREATGVLGDELVAEAVKYAVVIGVCDYPGEDNDICDSDGDSYNMVTALIENYEYDPGNIYWFRDMGGNIDVNDDVKMDYKVPSYDNIRDAIIGTADTDGIKDKVTSNDEVVFFFSGHGTSGIANDGDDETIDEGIVVHDNDGNMDEDGSSALDLIWDGELRSWFNNFATERIAFIFDTCLAGGMNDVAGGGRVVVMSSKETQYSYVYSYGEFGEGMFSRHFVNEGMLQGLADGYNQIQDKDNAVAVEEALDYAKENFPPYLKFRQNPLISDDFKDDLLL